MQATPTLRFLLKNKALNYSQFRNYLAQRFCLIMALNMQTTIVSYMLYQLARDEYGIKHAQLSLGMLGLAEVIPAVGFSIFSGHLTDRREKKGLLLQCIGGYVLLSLFFIMLALPSIQKGVGTHYIIWLIYLGTFVGGALRAFVSPATFALLGGLIPRRLYAGASTWSSSAWQFGAVAGPLVGGLLLGSASFSLSLAGVTVFAAIAFAVVLAFSRQQPAPSEHESFLKSLKEGLQLVFHTELILAALALDMFAVLFGGAVALLPVYADDILKVGPEGYGWLRAAASIGSVFTLLMFSVIPLRTNPGIKLLLSIAGFGITTIVFGISTSFVLSFAMLLLGGAFDAVSVVIRSTILQLYTPCGMRGRVAAVNTMFISSSNEIGALESGVTARAMGTVPAVVFGGCMTLLVVVVTWFKSPALRKLDLNKTV
jgi:MFS family permease